jgi:hypothetical protein
MRTPAQAEVHSYPLYHPPGVDVNGFRLRIRGNSVGQGGTVSRSNLEIVRFAQAFWSPDRSTPSFRYRRFRLAWTNKASNPETSRAMVPGSGTAVMP